MKTTKKTSAKLISFFLAVIMIIGLLPLSLFAVQTNDGDYVYISISFDGKYINDKNGSKMIYVPVSISDIESVDLTEYGLDNMLYDEDDDGDYETTALQLIIYAHEELWGGSWNDVSFDAIPGSSYFRGGIFGFTENLIYFHNGAFPYYEDKSNDSFRTGATSDRIVLEAGDYIDIASFTCFSFVWDMDGGFHFFSDEYGNFIHEYTAQVDEPISLYLIHNYCDLMTGIEQLFPATDYEIYYGKKYNSPIDTLYTDSDGYLEISFDEPGTYYIWCDGGNSSDEMTHIGCDYYSENGEPCIVSSPAVVEITITGNSEPEPEPDPDPTPDPEEPNPEEADIDTVLKVIADEGINLTATASFCDECNTQVYNGTQTSSIETTINWACEEHGINPDIYFYNISIHAFYDNEYVVTGVTVNGTKYDVDMYDEEYSTIYIDDYSYIAENTNCISVAILSAEETAPADHVIHIHAEKVKKEETPRKPQDVSTILNATLEQLATTVSEPSFGTNAGEWTVFSLARGNYFTKDNVYFTDYYNRIVETVNETAASVNLNGGLDKNKSTENSRLIVALSAIGKDARAVGDWNLVEAYSANGIKWIKKQGMNGTIWTLIALDSGNYGTYDPTIRQQCVDSILAARHDDGGWSLVTAKAKPSNVDITCMTLTALYPYLDQPEVAAAAAGAIQWLSEAQLATGGFPYGQGETSESCAWAIVALTMYGINPDTDARFIKDGKSCVDNLLTYYVESDRMFAHAGTESNAMATDQASYALVAYDRFINGKKALFDYSDVTFEVVTPNENPTTPENPDDGNEGDNEGGNTGDNEGNGDNTENTQSNVTAIFNPTNSYNAGDKFNVPVYVTGWDNNAGYKLLDMIIAVAEGINITNVTSKDLNGGSLYWEFEEETGKLRIVYIDTNANSSLTVTDTNMPEIFNIEFQVDTSAAAGSYNIYISGMSLKFNSNSEDDNSMNIVKTENANGTVTVVTGISFTAQCLYTGDDVDIIPKTKKAVAISITAIENGTKIIYRDGNYEVEFKYSEEISTKTGKASYIALVDSSIPMENFVNADKYAIEESENASTILFGDSNNDGIVNAQDALAAVNVWLRKTTEVTDDMILSLNVNADSRINTYDALGIVESFVNNTEFGIITKATLKSE